MTKLKFGIAGHGIGKRLYYPVLEEFECIDPVFIQLPHLDYRDFTICNARRFNYDLEGIDLLLVGTPPFAHEYHVELGINQKVPVICEKPVGLSWECPVRLKLLSASNRVPVGVNYQLRFDNVVAKFSKIVEAVSPTEVDIVYKSSARKNKDALQSWYLDEREGGGVQFSVLPHLIDLVHFFGYFFKDVNDRKYRSSERGSKSDWCDSLQLDCNMVGGIKVNILLDTQCDFSCFIVKISNGIQSLIMDVISGLIYEKTDISKLPINHGPSSATSGSDRPWRSAFKEMISKIISVDSNLSSGIESCACLREAERVHRVIDAIRASRDEGGRTRLSDQYFKK